MFEIIETGQLIGFNDFNLDKLDKQQIANKSINNIIFR